MKVKLQGAVLVIGSLFWENGENSANKELGELRERWRNDYLDISKAFKIQCPIRYGRKSKSRKNTFTMVFSNNTPAFGTGYLIPFKDTISADDDFKLLYEQAILLARSEGISKQTQERDFTTWGMVALKLTTRLRENKEDTYNEIHSSWAAKHAKLESNNYRISMPEEPCVTSGGFANFEILFDDTSIDYILCTPVAPEQIYYPTAQEIAQAMITSGYYTYFIENQKAGINTFQDVEIRSYLPTEKLSDLPELSVQLVFENYLKTEEGYVQFQKDLISKLGESVFSATKVGLCFSIIKSLAYPFSHTPGIHGDEVENGCTSILGAFENHFGSREILFNLSPLKKNGIMDKFLFYLLEFEKIPGVEKELIEWYVKDDLGKRNRLISFYEQTPFVKEFKKKPFTPRNHSERMLYDFYVRNIDEQQTIVNYYLNGINDRAIEKSKPRYTTIDVFDWYHDRPYLSSFPNSEEYFDHRKINNYKHRISTVPIREGKHLKNLYNKEKTAFYHQLQDYFSFDAVIHEMKYYVSIAPDSFSLRKPLFDELYSLFNEKKWYGFYSLALSQVEGIFSEMSNSVKANSKLSSLTDKVEYVRPSYEYSQQYFDYYQYYIPIQRNRFMHSGIDVDIEIKSYDLLYDLHNLLKVYSELKTPFSEISSIIKRSQPSEFLNIEDFVRYFYLLEQVKETGHFEAISALHSEFEINFLSSQIDFFYLANETAKNIQSSFEHWYSTAQVYTELTNNRQDLRSMTLKEINKKENNTKIILNIKPYYLNYKEIFDNLIMYATFLDNHSILLPNIPQNAKDIFEKTSSYFKDHFEKLKAVIRIVTNGSQND